MLADTFDEPRDWESDAEYGQRMEWAKTFGRPYSRRFRASHAARPVCACCGSRYGQMDTDRVVATLDAKDLPIAPYRGNRMLVAEKLDMYGSRQARLVRETWDGSAYRGRQYDPFCTLRCALTFAQRAHRAGYRVKP